MSYASRILSLSPHPDDSELGAGGFLSKSIKSNSEIHIAIFSRCIESLPSGTDENVLVNEFDQSMDRLGIPDNCRHRYDFPVRRFSEFRQDILELLVMLRQKINPDLVLLPSSFDIHQDHIVIHEEGIRAFSKNSSILGYELPWNTRMFHVQHLSKLNVDDIEKKIHITQTYRSQVDLKRPYFSENFIRSLAITRGVQAGCELAEAFEVIRTYD